MKKLVFAAAMAAGMVAVPALADNHGMKAEVIERDAKGKPTKVRIDGKDYMVCTSDNSDGCINPREAGLKFGNHAASKWPGRPISREN
ncbi:MAG: hypothetical protein KJZ64_07140 [Sphingomonadaceae bacterium]|nr:hypothetical protein [Sphingomonadaceae bacterium]